MNKLKVIIELRKIEIWMFLKEIRTNLKISIFVFFWMATIVTIILCWGMVNKVNILTDFLVEQPLYLEVMGNMILIPIKFCFVFWIIDIFVKFYMRFIANDMDDDERAKAGIKSSLELTKGIRMRMPSGSNLWKLNAKETDEISRQVTILKQWMKTLRINPYIDTSTKIKICNEIREIWQSAKACKSYFDIQENEDYCDGDD